MKKIILILAGTLLFYSCLNNDDRLVGSYELLPIDEYTAPAAFTFGATDTLKLKYTLKNNCYYFDNIYYEYQDTTRIVAIRGFIESDKACTDKITQRDYNLIVTATQKQDYLFKLYKGKDNDGKDIFEDVIVPVN